MGIRRKIIILGIKVSGGISIHHGYLKGIFFPFSICIHTHTPPLCAGRPWSRVPMRTGTTELWEEDVVAQVWQPWLNALHSSQCLTLEIGRYRPTQQGREGLQSSQRTISEAQCLEPAELDLFPKRWKEEARGRLLSHQSASETDPVLGLAKNGSWCLTFQSGKKNSKNKWPQQP